MRTGAGAECGLDPVLLQVPWGVCGLGFRAEGV